MCRSKTGESCLFVIILPCPFFPFFNKVRCDESKPVPAIMMPVLAWLPAAEAVYVHTYPLLLLTLFCFHPVWDHETNSRQWGWGDR